MKKIILPALGLAAALALSPLAGVASAEAAPAPVHHKHHVVHHHHHRHHHHHHVVRHHHHHHKKVHHMAPKKS